MNLKQKNIVIFHTDQQRFDSLGCNGNVYARTENIDALARDGCNFSRHISCNSVCMPSRASFFTGMYVPGHGVSSNGIPLWTRENGCEDKNAYICETLFGAKLERKIPTIADILGENGYQTASFGKLHFEPHLADKSYNFYEAYSTWEDKKAEDRAEPYYGFQTCKIVLGHGESPCEYNHGFYGRWLHKNYPELIEQMAHGEDVNTKIGSMRKDIYASRLPAKLHHSMWLADESCDYLETHQNDEKPIFMFVGFPDPHHPITPPAEIAAEFEEIPIPEFADKQKIKGKKPDAVCQMIDNGYNEKEDIVLAYRYTQASVHLIDMAVGQVVEKLKKLNMYDDTIILFTSDHGDFMGDFDMLCKADIAFYNLVHLPFIIKPYKDYGIAACNHMPMSNADVVPTLLSMVGINIPKHIQGMDIFGGEAAANLPMTTCYNAIGTNHNLSLFDKAYRYTYYVNTKEEELYNHEADPFEYENLAGKSEYRALCSEFKLKLLEKHLESDCGLYNHYGMW